MIAFLRACVRCKLLPGPWTLNLKVTGCAGKAGKGVVMPALRSVCCVCVGLQLLSLLFPQTQG